MFSYLNSQWQQNWRPLPKKFTSWSFDVAVGLYTNITWTGDISHFCALTMAVPVNTLAFQQQIAGMSVWTSTTSQNSGSTSRTHSRSIHRERCAAGTSHLIQCETSIQNQTISTTRGVRGRPGVIDVWIKMHVSSKPCFHNGPDMNNESTTNETQQRRPHSDRPAVSQA